MVLVLAGFLCLTFTATAQTENAVASPGTMQIILGNQIIMLFLVVGLGMMLGKVQIKGISLGSSGVIFVALMFGALGYGIPRDAGRIGLIIFVYCIGISAGPTFFRVFVQQGANLARLGVAIVVVGTLVTLGVCWTFTIPADLAAGIFAGAMTSTPALASAMDALGPDTRVSIGYGIAYPFGVIGVVLFVQLLPRLLKVDLDQEDRKHKQSGFGPKEVQRALIEVQNPMTFGKKITAVPFIESSRCQICRTMENEALIPITPDSVFEEGQLVLAVGQSDRLPDLVHFLGKKSTRRYVLDLETQDMKIVCTSKNVTGKTLRELNLLNRYGVTISRIRRNSVEFVPHADTVVNRGDVLVSVGEPEGLQQFAQDAGHRARVIDETDLISLTCGLTLGIIVGMMPIGFPGGESLTLGISGGPLLVGLILGHFGHIGPIRGHIPRAARNLLSEVGLVFFLAGAGIKAGGRFFEVLQEYGVTLLIAGIVVTSIPMTTGYLLARRGLKMNLLQTLGGICGSMTSTPGLGVIRDKTESEIPIVSYATAYPVALILMTLFAQLIVKILG